MLENNQQLTDLFSYLDCFKYNTAVKHEASIRKFDDHEIENAVQCQKACQKNSDCTSFTWNINSDDRFEGCNLINGPSTRMPEKGVTYGNKFCNSKLNRLKCRKTRQCLLNKRIV